MNLDPSNDPRAEYARHMTRRGLLGAGARGLGGLALGGLLGREALAGGGLPSLPHFAPKAKRVIWLFMAGGPSHIDMVDYKPSLRAAHGQELPESVRAGQRLTTMTSEQDSLPVVAPMFDFKRYGEHGTWVSELLPHFARIVDKVTIVKSMHTEAINHDQGVTFINTGTQQPGKPSMGAWLSYGLGSMNRDLPEYVVMISRGRGNLQPLYQRLWGAGFLPSEHQGVRFRAGQEPVLYLNDPPGIERGTRRRMMDALAAINERKFEETGDPEVQARTAQYELAFRMQASVPELTDLSSEPQSTFDLYGEDARRPGSFAANCVLARRLVERDVRFVQLYHRGWDAHFHLPQEHRWQCEDTDRASAALVLDLERRGLLQDTVVIWGGEFGRTIYSQGELTKDDHGRDHHGRCFHSWLAGGGVKRGFEYGSSDDYCFNVAEDPVHITDLSATVMHLLGIDHERFTYPYQGLDQRLTGVDHGARVVRGILA